MICKACGLESGFGYHYDIKRSPFLGHLCIHSGSFLKSNDTVVEPHQDSEKSSTPNGAGNAKVARKKLKGKRAVVRWLKFFRWKKKKEYERMTAEEKLLYKLKKVNSAFLVIPPSKAQVYKVGAVVIVHGFHVCPISIFKFHKSTLTIVMKYFDSVGPLPP